MEITKLNQMFDVLKSRPKKRLVAAYAMDDHTVCAVNDAVDNGLIDATLIGDPARIAEICKAENIDINKFRIVEEKDDVKAAALACDLINRGEGDILMRAFSRPINTCAPSSTRNVASARQTSLWHT